MNCRCVESHLVMSSILYLLHYGVHILFCVHYDVKKIEEP